MGAMGSVFTARKINAGAGKCVFAGLLASAISYYLSPGINTPLLVLSSVIVMVPGLALTMGLAELSARNMVSGTSRVMDAIMQLFKLYFGALLGMSVGISLFGSSEIQAAPVQAYWINWLSVFLLSVSLAAIFRTRIKHIHWALLSAFIAYGATVWSSTYLAHGLGTFVGAFALGIYANLFTRLTNAHEKGIVNSDASGVLSKAIITRFPNS